eukprot:80440-Prymnesium_polylepis.1
MLGTAARVAVSKERCTMIATGQHNDAVAERIQKIRAEFEDRRVTWGASRGARHVGVLRGGPARVT